MNEAKWQVLNHLYSYLLERISLILQMFESFHSNRLVRLSK